MSSALELPLKRGRAAKFRVKPRSRGARYRTSPRRICTHHNARRGAVRCRTTQRTRADVRIRRGGLKTRDWKTRDQTAGVENAGLENPERIRKCMHVCMCTHQCNLCK